MPFHKSDSLAARCMPVNFRAFVLWGLKQIHTGIYLALTLSQTQIVILSRLWAILSRYFALSFVSLKYPRYYEASVIGLGSYNADTISPLHPNLWQRGTYCGFWMQFNWVLHLQCEKSSGFHVTKKTCVVWFNKNSLLSRKPLMCVPKWKLEQKKRAKFCRFCMVTGIEIVLIIIYKNKSCFLWFIF